MPTISVIIVNFNAKDVLRNCLASLPSTAPLYEMETLVVDNASHDGSVEMARSEFPWATVIANERNMGFSAANNQALAMARGDYLLLLNCDTIVHDDALGAMADFLSTHPQAGAVSTILLNDDGSYQQAAYRFNTLWSEFCEHTKLRKAPEPLRIMMRLSYPVPRKPMRVDWVTGAVLMVKREVYEKVGGLDEAFFMYAEDADWCARIRSAGYSTWLIPERQITHLGGRSSSGLRREMRLAMFDSKYRFLRKNGFARPVALVRGMAILGLAVEAMVGWVACAVPSLREKGRRACSVASYCLRAHLFGYPKDYLEIVARRTGRPTEAR
jgi:N-acetylglucosaminyl-diphospho-decaprenol L-rhamnosyltransferase